MRKSLLMMFGWIFSSTIHANLVNWDGEAGDGQWSTALNWSANELPGPGDSVILDNSLLFDSYTVTLPSGGTTVSVQALIIQPNATLRIVLVLPSSNTADPGLNISGMGETFVLQEGAVFRNQSGATTGSGLQVASTFRINNGGRYVHSTSRGNASIVARLSAAPGTELGVFEFDVPVAGYTLSLSNRIFGTLELSAFTKADSVSYVGNGANPLRINGHLLINPHVSLSINFSTDVIIHGNYLQAASSTFDLQSGAASNLIRIRGNFAGGGRITESGTGAPVLELSGSVEQEFGLAGQIINQVGVRVNNENGVRTVSPVHITGVIDFSNGKLKTDSVNLLILGDDASCTSASTLSFVDGPVKKIGNDNFIFPVGKGEIFAPLTLSNVSSSSTADEFVAEYFRQNPQAVFGDDFDDTTSESSIDHISFVEYWTLRSSPAVSATKIVGLQVNCESFCMDFQRLFVASLDAVSLQWRNQGSTTSSFMPSAECPGYMKGTISSAVTDRYHVFTLGTGDTYSVNPLPVSLISFRVFTREDKHVMASWEIAEPVNSGVFELERSKNGLEFERTASIPADRTLIFYQTEIPLPGEGIYYYRLKIDDKKGKITYSRILRSSHFAKEIIMVSIVPVPVNNEARISIVCPVKQVVEWGIFDLLGRGVRRGRIEVSPGSHPVRVRLNDLSAGAYFLSVTTPTGQSKTIQFIKR
jgi:hypothetical protein